MGITGDALALILNDHLYRAVVRGFDRQLDPTVSLHGFTRILEHITKHLVQTLFVGQHLVPSGRQNITSSGTLLALDRPGLIYKALTWGGRALSTFDTATYGDADSGIRGPAQVRDTGITLFGVNDFSD